MKKKLSILAALVLTVVLSTGSVAGTYAKYISSVDDSDEARVAYWGIGETTNIDNLFKKSYGTGTQSNDGSKILAPGTKGQYTFAFTGTAPEVAYQLKVDFDGTKYTSPSSDMVNLLNQAILFTLKDSNGNIISDNIGEIKDLTLSDFTTAVEDYFANEKAFDPNTALDTTTYVIEWNWDFDNNGAGTYDVSRDTVLGDYEANINDIQLNFVVKVSAVQLAA